MIIFMLVSYDSDVQRDGSGDVAAFSSGCAMVGAKFEIYKSLFCIIYGKQNKPLSSI